MHLRPTEAVEEIDGVIGEDVRHTPDVPQKLGLSKTRGAHRYSILSRGASISQRGVSQQCRPASCRAPHKGAPGEGKGTDLRDQIETRAVHSVSFEWRPGVGGIAIAASDSSAT